MPQTQSAQEIVSQPGFWDRPEKDQIASLGSANPKFKSAPPEVQKKVLETARSRFSVKPGQPPSPPSSSPSNVGPPNAPPKPTEPPVPGMEKLGALPGPPEPRKPALPWEMSFQQPSQYAREHPSDIPQAILDKTTHGVGQLAQGIEGMTSDTTKEKAGAAHKIVEGATDAATPVMLGVAASNPLTFAKVATTATVSQSIVTESLKGMGLPEEYAQVAGDLAGVIAGAKAYNRAKIKAQIEPILRERLLKLKQGEMGKGETFARGEESVKVGGKEFPVTERTNTPHAEKAVAARGKSGKQSPVSVDVEPKTPEAIERRIGELQDQLNDSKASPAARTAAEVEIKRLQSQHPEHSLDPAVAAAHQTAKWEAHRAANPKPASPPEPPTTQTAEAVAKRKAEADARGKAPRKPVGDLGYRVAPEETGELPRQQPPVTRGVGVAPKETPAVATEEGMIPDGTQPGAGSAMEGQQFTAEKLPGVPKGSKVIFRESTDKGTVIDIVDPSGRTTQATLPYRDSVKNMEGKGWIKAVRKPVETFEAAKPGQPPSPPPTPVEEVRTDTRGQRALPAPPSTKGTPEGPVGVMTPQELGRHPLEKIIQEHPEGVRAKTPLQIPGPPDPSGLANQPEMPLEEQLALAKKQPQEVVQNFISKMQEDFLKKIEGVDINKLDPEQKSVLMDTFRKMQEYLEPFQELVGGKPKATAAAEVTPPPAASAGTPPAKPPTKLSSAPPAATQKKSAVPQKKTTKPAASSDLKLSTSPPKGKPGQPPSPPPTDISTGIVKSLTAKAIPKYLMVEVPGANLKWTKPIGGGGDLEVQVQDIIRQSQTKGYKTVTIQPANMLQKPYGEPVTFQATPAEE